MIFLNRFVTSYFCELLQKRAGTRAPFSCRILLLLWLERLELSCWNFGGFLSLRFALKLWFSSDMYFFSWNMEFEQVRKVVHGPVRIRSGKISTFWECDTFCGMSPTNLLIFSSPRRISSRSYWRSTATQLLFSVVIWSILFSRVRVLSFIPWHSHYQADLVGRENDKERGQVDLESVIRLDLMEKLRRKLQLILDNFSFAIGIFWTRGEWGCGCGFGCGWRLCLTACIFLYCILVYFSVFY
jgi:hypothetical protein